MSEHGMVVMPPGAGQIARQGFGENSLEKRDSAANAIAERARAEVQARYVMALQRPRNLDAFRVRILDHCKRPRFADKAKYSKPVGGKDIVGPSIRFVEAALAEYGNVLPESMIVFEDETKMIVRVTVTDLERNITHAAEAVIPKTVERKYLKKGQKAISSRVNSYGDVVYLVEAIDDEVANKKASAESKLIRNLGLRILPADIVEEAMDRVDEVQEAEIKRDPDAARKAIIDAFHGVGVGPEDLVEYLGHDLSKMVPAELTNLRALFATIRDGEGTWHAAISAKRAERGEIESPKASAPPPAKGTQSVKERVAQRQAQKAQETASQAPAPADQPSAPPPSPATTPASTAPASAPATGGGRGRGGKGKAAPAQTDLLSQPPAMSGAELIQEIEDIERSLETIVMNPQWVPGIRDRIAALPESPKKATLQRLLQDAESDIAAAERDADDVPDFDGAEG